MHQAVPAQDQIDAGEPVDGKVQPHEIDAVGPVPGPVFPDQIFDHVRAGIGDAGPVQLPHPIEIAAGDVKNRPHAVFFQQRRERGGDVACLLQRRPRAGNGFLPLGDAPSGVFVDLLEHLVHGLTREMAPLVIRIILVALLHQEANSDGSFQGSRYGLVTHLSASGSPTKCSRSGSHRTCRPSRKAMFPTWQAIMEL